MTEKSDGARFLAGDAEVVAAVRRAIRVAFSAHSLAAGDLEDVEQDSLSALLIAVREGRFRGESTLASYARRIAHYKCIDRVRLRGRRPSESLGDEATEIAGEDPRAAELGAADTDRLLRALEEELKPECLELLRRVALGQDYTQMAAALGIKEGALRVRISRCRKAALGVRARLFEEGPGAK